MVYEEDAGSLSCFIQRCMKKWKTNACLELHSTISHSLSSGCGSNEPMKMDLWRVVLYKYFINSSRAPKCDIYTTSLCAGRWISPVWLFNKGIHLVMVSHLSDCLPHLALIYFDSVKFPSTNPEVLMTVSALMSLHQDR